MVIDHYDVENKVAFFYIFLKNLGDVNMRVVSWNMNKRRRGNWEWIIENLDPDFILAQEASPLPTGVKATTRTTTKKSKQLNV